MSDKITKILKTFDIECANKPIGYWEYPSKSEVYEKHGLRNDSPDLAKVCTIFETLGEKRAGTHLLQGLNMILWAFLTRFSKETNWQTISELFPEDR